MTREELIEKINVLYEKHWKELKEVLNKAVKDKRPSEIMDDFYKKNAWDKRLADFIQSLYKEKRAEFLEYLEDKKESNLNTGDEQRNLAAYFTGYGHAMHNARKKFLETYGGG